MTATNLKTSTINVMAPLVVGNPRDLLSERSKAAWNELDRHLATMSDIGIDAVSTDNWWRLVEETEGKYNWTYIDELVERISRAKLLWVPIVPGIGHACGGNVGDDEDVPMVDWLFRKVAAKLGVSEDAVKYRSEQGNLCAEAIPPHLVDHVLDDSARFMTEFQNHFRNRASMIPEINVTLGPSGELRYPSYNSHDKGTDWPWRGGLQCYSSTAVAHFRAWALAKYGSYDAVGKAWNCSVGAAGEQIRPPMNPVDFFNSRHHLSLQYGRDFFDWYSGTLHDAGRKVLRKAVEIFSGPGAAFRGIDIGAKVPGVHWRIGEPQGSGYVLGDRLAELPAGLISTSGGDWAKDEDGRGYRPIVSVFKDAQPTDGACRVVMHFTCLEMPDGVGGSSVKSLASTLVRWVGEEAHRQGVPLKGENALAGNLQNPLSWQRMRSFLTVGGQNGRYEGLTLLRMSNILANYTATEELRATVKLVREQREKAA